MSSVILAQAGLLHASALPADIPSPSSGTLTIGPLSLNAYGLMIALGILAEAGLSYVGLGAQPPMPSWGRMLFDAQTRMIVAPYLAIFPGMAIVVTVLGLNLIGNRFVQRVREKYLFSVQWASSLPPSAAAPQATSAKPR